MIVFEPKMDRYTAACLRLDQCALAYAAAYKANKIDGNTKRLDDAYAAMALAYYQRERDLTPSVSGNRFGRRINQQKNSKARNGARVDD